ncbi:hypothetical protein HK104_000065 [Borealophlyctis nickersoniae]|nr:hypothetical protein HK104_000065 [Borealophlyctis nickersoniae]
MESGTTTSSVVDLRPAVPLHQSRVGTPHTPPTRVRGVGASGRVPEYLSDTPVAARRSGLHGRDLGPDMDLDPSYDWRRTPLSATLQADAFASPSGIAPMDEDTQRLHAEPTGGGVVSLPTSWSSKDKCQHLELSASGLRVSYTGSGKSDSDAAAVRANCPIPPQCGLYYFEITVLSKGRDGYIGIGFSASNVALDRLPGWNEASWGYHGDDGHSFASSGTGKQYGPTYTTGDVIGCIINFLTMTASFTKNGQYLGVAFRDITKDPRNKGAQGMALYPSIGLRTPGEIVEANFGQKKFVFDIEHHFKEEKAHLWQSINATPLPSPISVSSSKQGHTELLDVNDLVLDYLVHHGFSESAESFHRDAFARNVGRKVGEDVDMRDVGRLQTGNRVSFDDSDLRRRQAICSHILRGDIDAAISETNEYYPSVLRDNRHIVFQLKCRKYLEMIFQSAAHVGNGVPHQGSGVENGNKAKLKQKAAATAIPDFLDVVKYGQELQAEFGMSENPDVRAALVETYSLLAYPDPFASPMAYLLDAAGRKPVADALNMAILESEGHRGISAVEKLVQHVCVIQDCLVNEGAGASGFVNLRTDCL